MPPITYQKDRDTPGRVKALEDRVARLESGSLFKGKSVLIQLATSFNVVNWPQSASFNVSNPSSTIVILWSATAFVSTNIDLTLVLNIDGTQKDSITMKTSNSTSVRLTLPTGMVALTGLTAGSHTAQIAVTSGTTGNDTGHIIVLEVPQ